LNDEKKIALLDLGMVGRTSPQMQESLIKLLIAISNGDGDAVVSQVIELSETTRYFKAEDFRRCISGMVVEQHGNNLKQLDVGRILLEVGRAAGIYGLYVPTELTLLGKTLLQLDQVGRCLDEKFSPNDAVKRHVNAILNQRLRKDANSGKLYSTILELKEFAGGLPGRVNKLLDNFSKNHFEVRVKANDVHLVLEGFQKIANRITMGLVLASLIIGASLLMNIRTSFQIFGYPGLAMLCFMAAAGGGFWLVFNILLTDHKTRKKDPLKKP
jgi:predicted unusual protein kinase regulating ubiquinone biosynthesis (AarF/ABC1/UbiB family)